MQNCADAVSSILQYCVFELSADLGPDTAGKGTWVGMRITAPGLFYCILLPRRPFRAGCFKFPTFCSIIPHSVVSSLDTLALLFVLKQPSPNDNATALPLCLFIFCQKWPACRSRALSPDKRQIQDSQAWARIKPIPGANHIFWASGVCHGLTCMVTGCPSMPSFSEKPPYAI